MNASEQGIEIVVVVVEAVAVADVVVVLGHHEVLDFTANADSIGGGMLVSSDP